MWDCKLVKPSGAKGNNYPFTSTEADLMFTKSCQKSSWPSTAGSNWLEFDQFITLLKQIA